jgi:hypothetical protein
MEWGWNFGVALVVNVIIYALVVLLLVAGVFVGYIVACAKPLA